MKDKLIVPKKCKAGFNVREDTYTGKLAYVIYNDGKVWRKETSWESWREKEGTEEEFQKILDNYNVNYHEKNPEYYKKAETLEGIPSCCRGKISKGVSPIEFDNVPTEGFVLNKKVGGYSSDWGSFRQAYARVYDPRGFEFEITLPNLLFILQETNSIRGKGLEGEFVYAWEGKDLVLLPVCSPDYKKCVEFTEMQTNKVSAKTLIKGATYVTKQRETLIYMGRFDWFEYVYNRRNWNARTLSHSKKHVFASENGDGFYSYSSISHLSNIVSETTIDNYAELMDNLLKLKEMRKVERLETSSGELTFPEIKENEYSYNNYVSGGVYKKINEKEFVRYNITASFKNDYNHSTGKINYKFEGYEAYPIQNITFENDSLKTESINRNNGILYDFFGRKILQTQKLTKEEVLNLSFEQLYVVKENGEKVKFEEYF